MSFYENLRKTRALEEVRRADIINMNLNESFECPILESDETYNESNEDLLMELIDRLPVEDDEEDKVEKILDGEDISEDELADTSDIITDLE